MSYNQKTRIYMKGNYEHLMVDLETLGDESYSAILSIGAVQFNLDTGETGDSFYCLIDMNSCFENGLIVNSSTLKWWMLQNNEAKKEVFTITKHGTHLREALALFSNFCNKEYFVWGNSPKFDMGILRDAYVKTKMIVPWDFRKERDVRTLVSFAPEIKENFRYNGTAHNALDDCYNQIDYCSKIWNKLNYK